MKSPVSVQDASAVIYYHKRTSSVTTCVAWGCGAMTLGFMIYYITPPVLISEVETDGSHFALRIVLGYCTMCVLAGVTFLAFREALCLPRKKVQLTDKQSILLGLPPMSRSHKRSPMAPYTQKDTSSQAEPRQRTTAAVTQPVTRSDAPQSRQGSPFKSPERTFPSQGTPTFGFGNRYIRDSSMLVQYLKECETEQEEKKRIASAMKEMDLCGTDPRIGSPPGYAMNAYMPPYASPSPCFGSSPLMKYNVAPSRQPSRNVYSNDENGSATDVVAARALLEDLGLASTIDDLTDNTRRLLARHLQDFVSAFRQNTEELIECGVSRELLERETQIQSVYNPSGHNVNRVNMSLADMMGQFTNDQLFQSKRRPGVNLIAENKSFERYINAEGTDKRGYVLQRLRVLAEDGYLGQMRWDCGGTYNGVEWTSKSLPTDAQVVMNAFCALMDSLLPPAFDGDRPFTRTHFLDCAPSVKGTNVRGRFLIFLSQVYPPNFKVVANGKIRETLPVRHHFGNRLDS